MIEASSKYMRVWRGANKLYPQSQNGFAAFLGPYMISDLYNGHLTVDGISKLMIPRGEMDSIIAEAMVIHGRLGIICEINSGEVNKQWRATGHRILSTFNSQVEQIAIAIDDPVLHNASTITRSQNGMLEYFITDKRYAREREIVQTMWDIAAMTLNTNVSKKHAATITRTLVVMHLDMLKNDRGLDTRQAKIIAPEWDEIRSNLIANLNKRLRGTGNFDHHNLNEIFASKLILGNKPQRATRKAI